MEKKVAIRTFDVTYQCLDCYCEEVIEVKSPSRVRVWRTCRAVFPTRGESKCGGVSLIRRVRFGVTDADV